MSDSKQDDDDYYYYCYDDPPTPHFSSGDESDQPLQPVMFQTSPATTTKHNDPPINVKTPHPQFVTQDNMHILTVALLQESAEEEDCQEEEGRHTSYVGKEQLEEDDCQAQNLQHVGDNDMGVDVRTSDAQDEQMSHVQQGNVALHAHT